jgi:hypothetical protein
MSAIFIPAAMVLIAFVNTVAQLVCLCVALAAGFDGQLTKSSVFFLGWIVTVTAHYLLADYFKKFLSEVES